MRKIIIRTHNLIGPNKADTRSAPCGRRWLELRAIVSQSGGRLSPKLLSLQLSLSLFLSLSGEEFPPNNHLAAVDFTSVASIVTHTKQLNWLPEARAIKPLNFCARAGCRCRCR